LRTIIASRPFGIDQYSDPRDPLAVDITPSRSEAAMQSLGAHWGLLGFDEWSEDADIGEDVELWGRHIDDEGGEPLKIDDIVPNLFRRN
jgi:hypothetical protein